LQQTKQGRFFQLCKFFVLLGLLGLGYSWIAARFGGIPCLFRLVTGLNCPGCGVTRMACLLPFGIVLTLSRCIRYVLQGKTPIAQWENFTVWAMVAVLVGFGFLRNFWP
jgi:hypothetical protein